MRCLRSLLALVFVCPWTLAAQTAPALPRVVPSTTIPAITRTLHVAAGGDLQAALDSAKDGDAIELPCPSSFTGNYVLRRSAVVVRPVCWAALPAGRMTPVTAAALKLPRVATPNAAPVFETVPGVHHVALLGLEVATASPVGTNTLLALGSDAQTTLAEIPHDLVLDRLYLHGTPTGTLRRCIALNSASTAIVESTCTDAHENGSDSQAILSWTGPGPYLIRGNYLEAGHEVIMFGGGGDPLIAGLAASDITIEGNYITRPLAWLNVWQVKNLLELKSARRVLIEGNVLERNWMAAQDGSGVVFKSTNQGGSCTWCGTTDVTMRWNIVRNVGTAFNLAAAPEGANVVPMARVSITDNLVVGIRVGIFTGSGAAFMVQGDLADVEIARNTVVTTGDIGTLIFKTTGNRTTRFRFTSNLVAAGTNYGVYGDNTGPGLAATTVYAPDGAITGNLFAGMSQYGDYETRYPAGNRFLRALADVGFRDVASGDFSRSAADSTGVDLVRLAAMTHGVVEGTPAPVQPAPVPTITLAQLRAAITAMDKVVSSAGRENAATKAALAPVAVYLHALLGATP